MDVDRRSIGGMEGDEEIRDAEGEVHPSMSGMGISKNKTQKYSTFSLNTKIYT